MSDNIEITEKDLIDRPGGMSAGGGGEPGSFNPLDMLKGLKSTIGQVKELIDMLKSMGVELPGFPGSGSKKEKPEPQTEIIKAQPNPVQMFALFLKMLEMKYGDISVNTLLEKLRSEHGDKKLSELLK